MSLVMLQLLTVLILTALSLALWVQRLSDERRFGFVLFSLFFALWIGIGIVSNIGTGYVVLFNRLDFVAPLWIVWAAYFFITRLVAVKADRLLKILTISVLTVSVITLYSTYVVAGIVPRIGRAHPAGFDVIRGPFYPLYVIFLIGIIFVVFWNLYAHYRRARGALRSQLGVVGISVAGTALVGMVLGLVVPNITGSSASSEYICLAGLVAVGGFMLAIIRHGLFDIKLTAVRSIAYLLSIVVLAAIYYIAAYLISITAFSGHAHTSFRMSALNIFLALVLAFIFQPVKYFFDKSTNSIFFRELYDSEAFYGRLSEVLTTESTDLRRLLQRIAKEIELTLKSEQVFLYIQRNHHHTVVGTRRHAVVTASDLEEINAYVTGTEEPIIVARMVPEYSKVHRVLADHEISIIVPLMQKDAVLGYLFLGNRLSGEYTDRDIKVLGTISNELVIAIQNALSVKEIKEINDSLQQHIGEATSELRTSNEQLKRLDAAKDEFVSMASHQLRTPLTSVKGYISMVLEGDAGEVNPAQRHLLEEAFMSSERMVRLISDFLNVSRLQTGKFIVETSPVNLADIIKQEIASLVPAAEARSLRLRYRKPGHFPILHLDEGKIRQVVMNFIDNAIYYSPEHTAIDVRLEIEDGSAVFTVQDHGIGVPKDEQSQLFTKFFRANNARRQRPDGTGVGLFLAKKIVVAHGGSIVFESVEGEGSMFGFRLPIKKLSEPPVVPKEKTETAALPK